MKPEGADVEDQTGPRSSMEIAPRRPSAGLPETPDWERFWAPYDEATYERALSYVPVGAAVLDIGAGDLRFARRLAARARVVYALELQPALIAGRSLPPNVIVLCGDARVLPFPAGIDIAVLLMRHCTHFQLYREKLEAVGCRRLITNARWRMGVECIDLIAPPRSYDDVAMGWYACRCGATGFRPGPPETLNAALADIIYEVKACPSCNTYQAVSDGSGVL